MPNSVVQNALDAIFAAQGQSPSYAQIFREVYGSDYDDEVEPYNYLRRLDLVRVVKELKVVAGQKFADLGCGRGGPGLWISRETGANLFGIDFAEAGILEAKRRADKFVVPGQATFEVGDLKSLPLPDDSLDGAISLAVIWMVPGPEQALIEAHRVLRPGARLVITSWDRDKSPPLAPPPIPDHRRLLERAGFVVETYETLQGMELLRRRVYELVIARRKEIAAEMGKAGAAAILFEAERALGVLDGVDYIEGSKAVFAAARKPLGLAS